MMKINHRRHNKMRTPKKVIKDIKEEAKSKVNWVEHRINQDLRDALWTKYAKEHPNPGYNNAAYHSWASDREKYIEANFHPIEMSSEFKEKTAKNFRVESYLDIARRTVATILISVPLIFSAGSCVSCVTDPASKASGEYKIQLDRLHIDIRNAQDFIRYAEIDSSNVYSFKATPEEISIIDKRLENLINYQDSVKNSSEYSKLEEASDVVENKGWRGFLGGITGAIVMGGLS